MYNLIHLIYFYHFRKVRPTQLITCIFMHNGCVMALLNETDYHMHIYADYHLHIYAIYAQCICNALLNKTDYPMHIYADYHLHIYAIYAQCIRNALLNETD